MSARIVAYTWAAGSATGASTDHQATSTIAVVEQATPGTTTYARPTVPRPFYAPEQPTDQLRAWDAALDTYTPAGLYSVTYSATTKRMTIASTNGTAFRPVMPENAALWTGFTQDLSAGWATSWTADDPPAAVAELMAATVEPAEDWAQIELNQYRHSRAIAVTWGNHQVHRVTLWLRSTDAHAIDPGFLCTGRVRIYQGSDTTDYSAINPDGVVDGYVVASTDLTEDGDLGEVLTVQLLVAVAR